MKIIKRFLLSRFKSIKIDRNSDVNYNIINLGIRSSFPVKLINSHICAMQINEGCIISYAKCYGDNILGRFVTITGPGTVVKSLGEGIEIGSFTSIGQNVCIVDFNHSFTKLSSSFVNHLVYKSSFSRDIITKKVTIEEDVFIGSNSVILPGVKLGRGAVIAAGSVVTKDVEKYAIVAGNPAEFKKRRFSDDVIDYLENLEWWNWNIEEIITNEDLFNRNLNNGDTLPVQNSI